MHDLHPVGNGMSGNGASKMHVLPWAKHNDHIRVREPNELKGEIVVDEIWVDEG